MYLREVWKKWRVIIFIPVAVTFVFLDVIFARPHLYWVTGYLFLVTIFITRVHLGYKEYPRLSKIPSHKPGKKPDPVLSLSEILKLEFEYIKETASEIMKERATLFYYYLAATGAALAYIGNLKKEDPTALFYRDAILLALSLAFNAGGWVTFLQLVRLRQGWVECHRAMDHLKQFFVGFCEYPKDFAKSAFRWNIETIPRPEKKMNVFYFSALLVSAVSSAAIAFASFIEFGINQFNKPNDVPSNYLIASFGLGFYHLVFQMFMYTALLEESFPEKI